MRSGSDEAFHLEDDSVAERLERLLVEPAGLVEIRHMESDVIRSVSPVSQLFAGGLRLWRARSDAEPTRNVIPSIAPAPIHAFRQVKPLVRTTSLCGLAERVCVTRAASIVSDEGPTTTAAEWLRR